MTKDMNLTQLLQDWIGEDEEELDGGIMDFSHWRNQYRASLREQIPSLLAKIEQHVLKARKDEAKTNYNAVIKAIQEGRDNPDLLWQDLADPIAHRIATIDALLNTKGQDNG